MNNILKAIIIIINVCMLYFAYKWYNSMHDYEPLILILGQVSTILILFFEKNITNNFIKKIDDSEISLDKNTISHIEDVKKSKIKIK